MRIVSGYGIVMVSVCLAQRWHAIMLLSLLVQPSDDLPRFSEHGDEAPGL
jgi:hypothetical protein